MKRRIKLFLEAFMNTIHKTLENLTFAGAIAIFIDNEFMAVKVIATSIFFILTVAVELLIVSYKEGGEK